MDLAQLPSSGDEFLDYWRVEGEVGKGGFSVVYRAVAGDGRVGAVKILLPESAQQDGVMSYDGELADRFLREARLLEQLDSPYTINMWDYGESDAGMLYMIFEFIDGRSLFDEIKHGGALEASRVVHILRQMLIGLNSAHALGILHRDIKPNNIMLFERDGDRDRVKLVDFGIAKMYGDAKALPGNDLTAAGLLVGTPRYMSPEQLKGQQLAPPSDLYSVGLCAIEMLTGRKCIPGKDRVKIVEAQLRPESIVLPPEVAASEGLRNVIHRLTQKTLETRYASAAEALRDLEALAGDPGATGDTVFESVPGSLAIPTNAPKTQDQETVLHRVNTSELDQLIAEQGGPPRGPDEPTLDDANARTQPNRQPADQSYGSGQFNRPQAGFGSGEYNRPNGPPQQSGFGSGEYNRPNGPPPQGFGSGEHPRPPVAAGSGEYAPLTPADQSGRSGEIQQRQPESAGTLESGDKLALAASLFLPGAGHLLVKQIHKGVGVIFLLLITAGLAWILLGPLAFADLFLVIRARKRREVEDLEFFPDYRDIL